MTMYEKTMKNMNIGAAAQASGISAKMIRHYEDIGLIPKVSRTDAGYRRYTEDDVNLLRFVKQARTLGFPTQQISHLIDLWLDQSRASAQVKQLAMEHIQELNNKINALQTMKATLEQLAQHCHGDNRSDCPILNALSCH